MSLPAEPASAMGTPQAALLVGALGLDQVAVGQCLLSQPLVGGAILGWIAGNPGGGLLAGAFFQFLCLTDLPVGASVPPDTTLTGLVGVAAFLALAPPPGWSAQAVLGLLAAGFLPLALLARLLDIRVRRWNRVWTALTERLVESGRYGLAQVSAVGGAGLFFLRAWLFALGLLAALLLLVPVLLSRFAAAAPAFEMLARLVPLVGLAALVAARRRAGWPAAVAAGIGAGVLAARGLA